MYFLTMYNSEARVRVVFNVLKFNGYEFLEVEYRKQQHVNKKTCKLKFLYKNSTDQPVQCILMILHFFTQLKTLTSTLQ